MKKVVAILFVLVSVLTMSFADAPNISGLSLEELLQLQGDINELIAANYTYTLLPGIYDCKNDFKWDWYNCKVLPGKDGTERIATITFHTRAPEDKPFLKYEVSSNDEGIKISLLQTGSNAMLFMVIQGAALEAVPYSGF